MNAPLAQDWTVANQQLLVAEFARLKGMLRSTAENAQNRAAESAAIATIAEARQLLREESAIDWLTAAFGLSGFERDLPCFSAPVPKWMPIWPAPAP